MEKRFQCFHHMIIHVILPRKKVDTSSRQRKIKAPEKLMSGDNYSAVESKTEKRSMRYPICTEPFGSNYGLLSVIVIFVILGIII